MINANGSYSLSSVAFSPSLVNLGNVVNIAQVTNTETGLSLGGTWTGSLVGNASSASTASAGWPTTLWATNTPAGMAAAGANTNATGFYQPATPAGTNVGNYNSGSQTNIPFARNLSSTNGVWTPTVDSTGATNWVYSTTNTPASTVNGVLATANIPTLNGGVTNLHVVSTWTQVPTNSASATSYTQDANGNTNVVYMANTNAASGSSGNPWTSFNVNQGSDALGSATLNYFPLFNGYFYGSPVSQKQASLDSTIGTIVLSNLCYGMYNTSIGVSSNFVYSIYHNGTLVVTLPTLTIYASRANPPVWTNYTSTVTITNCNIGDSYEMGISNANTGSVPIVPLWSGLRTSH